MPRHLRCYISCYTVLHFVTLTVTFSPQRGHVPSQRAQRFSARTPKTAGETPALPFINMSKNRSRKAPAFLKMPRDIIPENVRAGSEAWRLVVYKQTGSRLKVSGFRRENIRIFRAKGTRPCRVGGEGWEGFGETHALIYRFGCAAAQPYHTKATLDGGIRWGRRTRRPGTVELP